MTKIAGRETLLTNTAIVLKYPEKKKTAPEEYKCPTCKKGSYVKNPLNGHRGEDKICRIRRVIEKCHKMLRSENGSESFKNDRLLENHQEYHCKSIRKNLRILRNGAYNIDAFKPIPGIQTARMYMLTKVR